MKEMRKEKREREEGGSVEEEREKNEKNEWRKMYFELKLEKRQKSTKKENELFLFTSTI
jgi:hypothetical protein